LSGLFRVPQGTSDCDVSYRCVIRARRENPGRSPSSSCSAFPNRLLTLIPPYGHQATQNQSPKTRLYWSDVAATVCISAGIVRYFSGTSRTFKPVALPGRPAARVANGRLFDRPALDAPPRSHRKTPLTSAATPVYVPSRTCHPEQSERPAFAFSVPAPPVFFPIDVLYEETYPPAERLYERHP
jgi:hypothetical protein